MYPYHEGDKWSAREANEVVGWIRQNSTIIPERYEEFEPLVRSPITLDPHSVFGLGSTDSRTYEDPALSSAVPDPVSNSVAPYYTNGDLEFGAGATYTASIIGAVPVKLKIAAAITAGARAKPNDTGQAEENESGDLLCVSDSSPDNRFAWFVFSPAGGATTIIPRGVLTSGSMIENGLITVMVQLQSIDYTAGTISNDGSPVKVYLTYYGDSNTAIDDSVYGIASGDVIDTIFMDGGEYVCAHPIATKTKTLQVFTDCDDPSQEW